MDRVGTFIQENIDGYNLPADSISEIRGLLIKRFRVRFSESLSPEGRIAMEQTAKREIDSAKSGNSRLRRPLNNAKHARNNQHTNDPTEERKRNKRFTETYDRSSSIRLDGDITDVNYNEMKRTKRAIGGKIESAMETIEIVKYGELQNSEPEMVAIESANLQSVEKCLVWMEINSESTNPVAHTAARSRTTFN